MQLNSHGESCTDIKSRDFLSCGMRQKWICFGFVWRSLQFRWHPDKTFGSTTAQYQVLQPRPWLVTWCFTSFHVLQKAFQCRTFTFVSENFSAYFSVPTSFQPLSVKSLFRELLPLLIEEHDRHVARSLFGESFRSRVQLDSKQVESIS